MDPLGATITQERTKAMLPDMNTKEVLRVQTRLFHQIHGFFGDMSIKCAVELGIFDAIAALGGGPVTLSELSAALGDLHPSKIIYLPRILRLLTQLGYFATQTTAVAGNEEGYVLTPLSKMLVKNNPGDMASFIRYAYHPFITRPLYHFSNWFRSPSRSIFDETYGRPFWRCLKEDTELNHLFNDAMANESSLVVEAIIRDCHDVFEGVGSLVDVGGGTGSTAALLAEAFPKLKCTVLDLPHVVAAADPESIGGVAMVAGDMFEHIPPADAIFLKMILHNWKDDDCVRILKKCKEAIPSDGGKVIVVDMVVGSDKNNKEFMEAQLFSDICMMMVLDSVERNEEEWANIFYRAGFGSFKIKHALGLKSLIEIYP